MSATLAPSDSNNAFVASGRTAHQTLCNLTNFPENARSSSEDAVRSDRVRPVEWHRVFRHGVTLGLVVGGHLMLLLLLVAYHVQRVESYAAAGEDASPVLRVSLNLRRNNPAPAPAPAPPASMRIASPLSARSTSRKTTGVVQAKQEQALPAALEAAAPEIHDVETSGQLYGDPGITRALSAGSTREVPALPGYASGSKARGVDLAPPSGIRNSVRRIGDFLTCSQIQMKRQTAGYGLDRRLAQAYESMGCTL